MSFDGYLPWFSVESLLLIDFALVSKTFFPGLLIYSAVGAPEFYHWPSSHLIAMEASTLAIPSMERKHCSASVSLEGLCLAQAGKFLGNVFHFSNEVSSRVNALWEIALSFQSL